MPSRARTSLSENLQDIKRLIDLHTMVGGKGPGRRHGLEVLHKSSIVLMTAYWESYCEDIAAEGLAHIVTHGKSAGALPKELKKQLADDLKKAQNQLELWKIADKGWKTYLQGRLADLRNARNWDFNTPKADQIDKLFLRAIGINQISKTWKWPGMSAANAAKKLGDFVSLRGAIAHRGQALQSVKLSDVKEYRSFIGRLAAKTGGEVNRHVKAITNKPLW